MQYAKLTAGTEYLFSRSNNWRQYPSTASRVRLESLQRFNDNSHTWSRSVVATDKGSSVHVTYLDRETGEPTGTDYYVRFAQLRGTWQEANAEAQATDKAKQEETHRRQLAADAAKEEAASLAAAAAELGLKVQPKRSYDYRTRTYDPYTFHLSTADLKAFVDAAAHDTDHVVSEDGE